MNNIKIKELCLEGNKSHIHHYTVQYHYNILSDCRNVLKKMGEIKETYKQLLKKI